MTKPRKPKSKFRIAPPSFAPSIVKGVRALASTHSRKGGTFEYLEAWDFLILLTFIRKGRLYWMLRNDDSDARGDAPLIGAGRLKFIGEPYRILQAERAAILAPYQRRGLYPRVILSLRRNYGRPIESSPHRSLYSEKAWSKIGVKVGNRYRKNPSRK